MKTADFTYENKAVFEPLGLANHELNRSTLQFEIFGLFIGKKAGTQAGTWPRSEYQFEAAQGLQPEFDPPRPTNRSIKALFHKAFFAFWGSSCSK